jgi:hypothetical protein
MDRNTAIALAAALVVLLAVAFVSVYRQRGHIVLRLPFGIRLRARGSNDVAPGANIEKSSTQGGAEALDETGRGARISGVSAKGDIRATAREQGRPKA